MQAEPNLKDTASFERHSVQVPLDAPKDICKQLEQALQAAAKCAVASKRRTDAVHHGRIQSSDNRDSSG